MASVSDFISEDTGAFSCTVSAFLPRAAIVPFDCEPNGRSDVLVRAGDIVREGQTIAQSTYSSVQATIPGTVEAVSAVQLPDGTLGQAATINLGGAFSFTGKPRRRIDWNFCEIGMIQRLLAEHGVVNTFAGCEPLCAQILNLHPRSARVLAVRLFDDDPSRVTEAFIAQHHATEVCEGAAIVAKAMGARGVVFAYGASGHGATWHGDASFAVPVCEVVCDTTRYPAGTRHDIVAAVKRQCKDEPFSAIGNRDVYIDAPTALAAYRAVALSTPLMETYVHVTGGCLNAAAMMRVRIGTTLGDLAAQCGGFKRPVAGIVVNGITTGFSVSSLAVPVSKMVKSVAFLPARKARRQHDEECVRCGSCRKVCPVGLYPDMFRRSFLHGADATELEKRFAETSVLCTDCALCNAVCPARLPLSQIAALLKGTYNDNEA